MTAIVVAPLVALCCLEPLFIGSAVGGLVGWLSGQGLPLTAVLAFLAAAIGFAVMRWRRASSHQVDAGPTCACDVSEARQDVEPNVVKPENKRRTR